MPLEPVSCGTGSLIALFFFSSGASSKADLSSVGGVFYEGTLFSLGVSFN